MNALSLETIQEVVDGAWRHARAARAACREARWQAFLDDVPPSPPKPGLLSFEPRRDLKAYQECRKHALERWSGPKAARLRIVPIWIGDHEGEEPNPDCWYRHHAMSIDDEPLMLMGFGPFADDADLVLDTMVSCRARLWSVGIIVETKRYAPDVELALRLPPYGVVESAIIEIEAVEMVESGRLVSKLTVEVPPFCRWTEPRVEGLPPDFTRKLYDWSITVDDEGLIIDRPAGTCLVRLS